MCIYLPFCKGTSFLKSRFRGLACSLTGCCIQLPLEQRSPSCSHTFSLEPRRLSPLFPNSPTRKLHCSHRKGQKLLEELQSKSYFPFLFQFLCDPDPSSLIDCFPRSPWFGDIKSHCSISTRHFKKLLWCVHFHRTL